VVLQLGGLGEVLTTPHLKMYHVTKCSHTKLQTWTDTLVQPKQWKRDMRFGTYPTKDSLRVADTLAKAKLQDLLHHMKLFLPKLLGKYSKDFLDFQMGLLDRTGHSE